MYKEFKSLSQSKISLLFRGFLLLMSSLNPMISSQRLVFCPMRHDAASILPYFPKQSRCRLSAISAASGKLRDSCAEWGWIFPKTTNKPEKIPETAPAQEVLDSKSIALQSAFREETTNPALRNKASPADSARAVCGMSACAQMQSVSDLVSESSPRVSGIRSGYRQ